MKNCARCGGTDLRPMEHVNRVEIGERTYSGRVAAFRCGKCGAEIVSAAELLAHERAVARYVADHGPFDGPGFAYLRVQLALQGTDLAELLDVRAETISRWENGRAPVDRNAWLVVGDMVRDLASGRDDTKRRIAALASPPKAKRIKVPVPEGFGPDVKAIP